MSLGNKVLVIDDDVAARLRVGDVLAQIGGFEVAEADDGRTGLNEARRIRPDLILLDIMMPGMTGFETCRALREDSRTREVPIIVLSAIAEHDAMIEAIEEGADDFLRKPFFGPELQAKVRTVARLNRFRRITDARNRFLWLLDNAEEPLVIADKEGLVEYANDRARELFALPDGAGCDIVAEVSRHFQSDPSDAWSVWRASLAGSAPPFAIYQAETPQMSARLFNVEFLRYDVDERNVLIRFVECSGSEQRDCFNSSFQRLISHKIRTPLNGLTPVLSMLNGRHATEEDERDELLQMIRSSANRLKKSLTSILRHQEAMFSAHRGSLTTSWHSLERVILAAIGRAGFAGSVMMRVGSTEVQEADRLELVLTEILENYVKFTEASLCGVNLRFERECGGTRWNVCCFAPGPALPPDVLVNLGQPFWQLDKTFSGEVPGVGLGLAIARNLMRQIGGDVRFELCKFSSGVVTIVALPACFVKSDTNHER